MIGPPAGGEHWEQIQSRPYFCVYQNQPNTSSICDRDKQSGSLSLKNLLKGSVEHLPMLCSDSSVMSGLNQTFHEKVKLTLKDMPQLRAAPDESSQSYGD